MTRSQSSDQTPNPSGAMVFIAMSLGMVSLSFASIFITHLERSEVPPLIIAFYRMAIATLLLFPAAVACKRQELATLTRKDILWLIVSGLFLALHFGAWITSLKYISIAASAVLVNTHPFFVVIAALLFLKEKPNRFSLMGTSIGLIGMLVIAWNSLADAEFALKGNLLAVLGALAVVGYFIIGRKVREGVSLLGYVTPVYAACSAFLLIWASSLGNSLYPYPASSWGYFFALAIVPTILGHTVFNWALKHVRPATVSLAFLGEPVIASILAYFFFNQRPTLSILAGGLLVLAGVWLTMQRSNS
ncbi:MAG: DMT family transporter [Acidobacteriota bacterium]